MQRILIVDDDKDLCFLLNRFLSRKGYAVTVMYAGLQAMEYLENNEPDLLISDLGLGDIDGISLLNRAKELYPNLPVIIITGFSDIKTSAIAMRQGAFDYVMKPLLPEQMLLTVQDALESRKRGALSNSGYHFSDKEVKEYYCWGNHESSKKLFRQVHLVAPTNHNVIIYGEDGTGKRSVGREIHKLSKRAHLPFVLLNPAGVSPKNIGAILFGAYTDIGEEKGLFDQANGGTIFMTDPQLLPQDIQFKLLQYMRQRAWTRQGGGRELEMDIRFFIASSQLLWDATRRGELVEDLYHKLNEFTVSITPLRERNEEIPDLANHFLKMNNDALGTNIKGITAGALSMLKTYTWYDNIRELKNFIQKAALQCSGSYIGVECLPLEMVHGGALVPGE